MQIALQQENLKLKREVEDLNYKLLRNQQTHYSKANRGANSSQNTTTIDFNSPGMLTIDAKLNKIEEEFGSPTTINHDLTTLKLEDLTGKKGDNYNPVWKL